MKKSSGIKKNPMGNCHIFFWKVSNGKFTVQYLERLIEFSMDVVKKSTK